MNKRGFTLVELLAVIVVLAIIILLAVPAVTKILDRTRVNAFVVEVNELTKVTRTAYSNALLQGSSGKTTLCYTVDDLIDMGLIDKAKGDVNGAIVIDPTTGSGGNSIRIYSYLSNKNYYVKNNGGSSSGNIIASDVRSLKNNTSVFSKCTSTCTATPNAVSVKCGNTEITTLPSGSNVNEYIVSFDADGGVINGQSYINFNGTTKYVNGNTFNTTWGTDHLIFDRANGSVVAFGVYKPSTVMIAVDFSLSSFNDSENQLIMSNVHSGGIILGVVSSSNASKPNYIYANFNMEGTGQTLYSKTAIQLNQRYRVIVSYDGVYYKMYVNGELAQKKNLSTEIQHPTAAVPIVLGANPNANTGITGAVDGSIQSGKIYRAYLSSNPRYTKSVVKNSTYGTLPTPTKQYYTFTGWYDSSNKLVTDSTVYSASGNTELVAKYTYDG